MNKTYTKDQFHIGQELWFVPSRRRQGENRGYFVKIKKIGREWLTCDNDWLRLSIASLCADGGQYSSPGAAYLSREAYEQQVRLNAQWGQVEAVVRRNFTRPKYLSEQTIAILQFLLTPPAEGYLLQNGYVGNSRCFWREGGQGYTENLTEAQVFTSEEADKIIADTQGSHEFKKIAVADAVARLRLTVD